MIVPMYPEKLLTFERKKTGKGLKYVLLCMGIVLFLLYMQIKDISILICSSTFLFIFSSFFLSHKANKKEYLWRVRLGKNSVDLIDYADDILKSTDYRYVRNAEIRKLSVSRSKGSGATVHIPCDCTLILIYFDGIYCFEDLRASECRLWRSDPEPFYLAEDIFYHHSCIALDYNEEAWSLLKEKCKGYIETENL